MPHRLRDRLWRLDNLYHIVDEAGNRIKFHMNNVQRELYDGMWYMNLILKARQEGITTFVCLFGLDMCLFNSNVSFGIIAHNREDAEDFFKKKVKFAYDNLPDWLRAERPAQSQSARELSFNNNSVIRVGTSLRSSTNQILHISEFGKICRRYPEKADEIVSGAFNTIHPGQIVFVESTAEGDHGYFYDYCQEAEKKLLRRLKLTPLDFKLFFFPWYRKPGNSIDPYEVVIESKMKDYFAKLGGKGINLTPAQMAWYAKKWEIQGNLIKREHPSTTAEAFERIIEGTYFSHEFEQIYKEGRITSVPYDTQLPVDTWWDLGLDDCTAIWFTQTVGQKVHVIDFYKSHDRGLPHYADVLRGRGYKYGRHVAPHDIKQRDRISAKSYLDIAREQHIINFEVAPKLGKIDQIESARTLLRVSWFDEEKCAEGIRALESYRREWDPRLETYKDDPLHDWASDPADAFMTCAVAHNFNSGKNLGFVPSRTTGTARSPIARRIMH